MHIDRHQARSPGAIREPSGLVVRHARGDGVQIFELAAVHGADENDSRGRNQYHRQRNQREEDFHRAQPRPIRGSRCALATTSSDDSDMPSAAIHGLSRPAAASGSTSRL